MDCHSPFTAKTRRALRPLLILGVVSSLVGCTTPPEPDEAAPATAKVSTAEWMLLEMNFAEAKAISAHHAEVGGLFRVAGDAVEVLKTDAEGKPLKVRAKGHVFLEMALADRATALCEEAVITPGQAVLGGNPMMMQGSRVAKSTSASTSFRITDHLRVSGRFELVKPEELMQSILAASNPLPTSGKINGQAVKPLE